MPPRGFRIPIVSGIPDSWTCILDSKALDSTFYKFKFPGFRIAQAKISRDPESWLPLYLRWSLGYSPSTVHDSYENMLYYDLKALISFILPFI